MIQFQFLHEQKKNNTKKQIKSPDKKKILNKPTIFAELTIRPISN